MRSVLPVSVLASTLLLANAYVVLRPSVTFARWSLVQLNLASEFSNDDAAPRSNVNASLVPWDWEKVAANAFQDDVRPIILFDGECNLCNGGVNFALDHDRKANFRFVSIQSKVGQSLLIRSGRAPDDLSSIVVCLENGEAFVNSDAVLMIAMGLNEPLPVVGKIGRAIPTGWRDAIYRYISENRYKFVGEYDSCRLDFDGEFDDRFVPDPDP